MNSDAASRRTLLSVAGVSSFCCVGPGAAAVTGGTTVGLVAGLVQGLVVFVVLGAAALQFRRRSDCSSCDA